MKRIIITVELCAEVPDSTPEEVMELISLQLDVGLIRIDGEDGPIAGAKVTDYMTIEVSG